MIVRNAKALDFSDGECSLRVSYDNDGDPWREGVSFEFNRESSDWAYIRVMLDDSDVRKLRDKLTELLGEKS
jgi:hypothetical protein